MSSSESTGSYAAILEQAADRWPDRVGLRYDSQVWTYLDLVRASATAAARLAAGGITAGTRVLLLMENQPEYLIAQFALARLGAAFVTPNPYWTRGEIERAIIASDAAGAIYAQQHEGIARTLDYAVRVEDLLTATPDDTAEPRFADHQDEALYIPFSSGTTGLPKGVVHTGASLCGGVEQLVTHLALTDSDIIQISLPLCHIFGTTMAAAAIRVGAEITLFRRFHLEASLAHIRSAGVTIWPLAGAVAHRLVQRRDLRPEGFASLRYFMWGGSSVPVELARTITRRTGVDFLCSYGMTEAMMVAFNPIDRPDDWQLDSPGFPTIGTEVRLAASGELEVRGSSVALGYAGAPSDSFIDRGWFRTGDLATIAANGRITIVGRIKEMLKVSGFQVSPVEIEDVILTHPDVADAGVVGRSDDRTGEAPVVFVVRTSARLSGDDLAAWAAEHLASYKIPHDYHFVDELPRTAGGKLRRAALATRVWSGQ